MDLIKDITGTILIPGNQGRDCPGNGEDPIVECCCEECDYLLCCLGNTECYDCKEQNCPKNDTKQW